MLETIASSPLPPLDPCDEATFAQTIRVLQASLPRRSADELSGRLVTAAYHKMLGHHSRPEIEWLGREALVSCDWFPTIRECSAILARFERRDEAVNQRHACLLRARAERQFRFDEVMAALERRELDQAAIDALPDSVKQIASERCLLWWHPDGSFTVRGQPDRAA